MTIHSAISSCLEQVSGHTQTTYRNSLHRFSEYLFEKNIHLDEEATCLKADLFINYPAWLLAQGLSKATMQLYLSGMNFFLAYLSVQGVLDLTFSQANRLKEAAKRIAHIHEEKLPKTPTEANVHKMIAAAGSRPVRSPIRERDTALLQFLWETGCRVAEVVDLKVSQLQLTQERALVRVVGKGKKEREVYMSAYLIDLLHSYWQARGWQAGDDPVFARHDKKVSNRHAAMTTTSIRNIVDEVEKMAGLPQGSFTPHIFRHGCLTKILRETHDIALTQRYAGHDSPATTQRYAKVDPDDIREAHKEVFG